jgi:hypothetical protein
LIALSLNSKAWVLSKHCDVQLQLKWKDGWMAAQLRKRHAASLAQHDTMYQEFSDLLGDPHRVASGDE